MATGGFFGQLSGPCASCVGCQGTPDTIGAVGTFDLIQLAASSAMASANLRHPRGSGGVPPLIFSLNGTGDDRERYIDTSSSWDYIDIVIEIRIEVVNHAVAIVIAVIGNDPIDPLELCTGRLGQVGNVC